MPVMAPERLRSSRDIAEVFATRTRRAGRTLVVHARATEDHAPARAAVVASRRVGNAVQRNRAKRLLREAARTLTWRPGHDVVLVARAAATDASLDQVVDDLEACASELSVIEATR